jgi:hypothetical protein
MTSRPGGPRSWLLVVTAVVSAIAGLLANAFPVLKYPALITVVVVTALAVIFASEGSELRRSRTPVATDGDEPLTLPDERIPDQVPLSLDSFRGRAEELSELARRHAAGRALRDSDREFPGGSLVIMLHGRPGTGKSALAREFAQRIAGDYPDGGLYANLGIGGDRRPPGEVLKGFLDALGWPDRLPTAPAGRARIFRSLLAERRVLVLLDAARDADQVRAILPTAPGCTVIVTSRQDLSTALAPSSRSLHIDVPAPADATEILRSAAAADRFATPVAAAEIVSYCGSLPIALQSAAEQAAEAGSLPATAARLADPNGRLAALSFRNRDIRGRLDIEYGRLTRTERRALQLLGLVDSETFLPWVLAPLMDQANSEAEDLVAKLYAAQFIDVAGADSPSGLARYRFHPLFLLYVRSRADELPESERTAARRRLDQAYLQAIEGVFKLLEPDFRRHQPATPTPYLRDARLPQRIRGYVDEWTRAEFHNLVTSVLAAADAGEGGLCWRIAERLGDFLPGSVDVDRCLAAFDRALAAAREDKTPWATISVGVARASFLLGVERHHEGTTAMLAAVALADEMPANERACAEVFRAYRVLAEAYLDAGAFGEAGTAAQRGLTYAEGRRFRSRRLDRRSSVDRRLLTRIADAVHLATDPAGDQPAVPEHDGGQEHTDLVRYRMSLTSAEMARRRQDWAAARDRLQVAARAAHGDGRRIGIVNLQLAVVALAQARSADEGDAMRFAAEAVDLAAGAVVGFQRLSCRVSAAQARLLLAEALLAMRMVNDAEATSRAQSPVPAVREHAEQVAAAWDGRRRLLLAELALARRQTAGALAAVDAAEPRFLSTGDWSGVQAARALRGRILDVSGDSERATEALHGVIESYTAAGDVHAVSMLNKQLSYDVARRLAAVRERKVEHAELVALTQRAFAQADRPIKREAEPELLTPGPVWVALEAAPSAGEIIRFRRFIDQGEQAYLVHSEALQRDGEEELDALRLAKKPVIDVRAGALRAAYTDRRMPGFLAELERTQGNQDSLFDTKNAIEDERLLFGRDYLLNTIGSALRRDEQILLTGLRKVGKTSLLNILRQHLADQPVCKLDLQMFDRNEEDWPRSLYRQMVEAYDSWAADSNPKWPFKAAAPATATELARELAVRAENSQSRLIVILDELERIIPYGPDEELATRRWIRATGALRALAQGDRRFVTLIGADLRPRANRVNGLGKGQTNPFFQFFREVPVPLLDAGATREMVTTIGRTAGVTSVTPAFHKRLHDLTGGHPSLALTVAGAAFRGRSQSGVVDRPDLDAGLDGYEVLANVNSFIGNLWHMLNGAEQAVLAEAEAGIPIPRNVSASALLEARAGLQAQGLFDGRNLTMRLVGERISELLDESRS